MTIMGLAKYAQHTRERIVAIARDNKQVIKIKQRTKQEKKKGKIYTENLNDKKLLHY